MGLDPVITQGALGEKIFGGGGDFFPWGKLPPGGGKISHFAPREDFVDLGPSRGGRKFGGKKIYYNAG